MPAEPEHTHLEISQVKRMFFVLLATLSALTLAREALLPEGLTTSPAAESPAATLKADGLD